MAEAGEVQPDALVTVKEYVPGTSPDIVVLDPLPVIDPGLIVQVPDGKPVSTTLPVTVVHVNCVIVPTPGADGVAGCALITIINEAAEVHPTELVTVNV